MLRHLAILAAAFAAQSALAADVGVSINVGQPGFYGQIDIGNVAPQVIYTEPVYIQRPPVGVVYEPLYLRVPPGHEKHWEKHCGEYHACGRPVYFVREDWYQNRYRHHEDEDRDHDRGHHDHEHDRHWDDEDHDRRDHDRDHGRGHGHDED
ncbi:MAG: hypothetical protein JO142_20600 [Burkholderiales bacterium]|nr:hypothetical protein [Burkholderiales bacterium]